MKSIAIKLTPQQARELYLVAIKGYGNGDYYQTREIVAAKAFMRAINILATARGDARKSARLSREFRAGAKGEAR